MINTKTNFITHVANSEIKGHQETLNLLLNFDGPVYNHTKNLIRIVLMVKKIAQNQVSACCSM